MLDLNLKHIMRSFSDGYLMRSRLLSSSAGVLCALALLNASAAQGQRVISLKPLSAADVASVGDGAERVAAVTGSAAPASLKVIGQPRHNPVSPLLAASLEQRRTDADAFVRAAVALYDAAGGEAIWYRGGGWTASSEDAYRILEQARFDGLESERYLADIDGPLNSLRTTGQAARADFALTVGLLRFALDLKFGQGHDIQPGTLGQGFQAAYSSGQLDTWIDSFRPETPLYLRLHKALMFDELTPKQAKKAAVTLHRERQPLMVHPERHIVVNIGLQQLKVYEDRQEVLAMPVVVGKPDRPTPLLADKIVNLKFSPDWSVPPKIAREDILPILRETPDLLAGLGLDVLNADRQVIDPASVDWHAIDPRTIPYRFHMQPGIDNLLGGVRFSLTNDFAIYLHDSPERDRFGAGVRSFSSGCVRVGDSTALATWIMGRQKNWTRREVIAAMVRGETRIEVLPNPIPVNFIYSTVGFNEEGVLMFKPDIYGEDAKLARSLGFTLNDVPPPLPKRRS